MNSIWNDEIESLLSKRSSSIARDLKLNLRRLLEDTPEGGLTPRERLFATLATATAVGFEPLATFAREGLAKEGVSSEQIDEAAESAAIMGMLNTYYRFKHMVAKNDDYKSAGLRMTALAKPALGKEQFEMLALAVSVVNGCETCIRAHEEVLRAANVSVEKIHDLARIAAVVKGFSTLGIQ